MNKKAHYAFLIIFTLCIFCPSVFVFADTTFTATYSATAGFDASTGIPRAFTTIGSTSDISKIAASDNKRMQSDAISWPTGDTFEVDKYIEFSFSPNIASTATIQNVSISHEFRRSGRLDGARMSVWDGTQFTDFPLTLGAQNVDHTDTFDITNVLGTPEKLNQTKARFLAYRGDGKTKTSHDYIGLSVTYSLPDVVVVLPPATGTNTAPVVQDQNSTTSVDMPISITFIGTDADNDSLTYTIAGNPTKGALGEILNNQITYTPNGTIGEDTFSYTANDGIDTSVPAIVHITNTPGVLQTISIDISNTTPTTGESISVAVYGEDIFGNVVQDTIQSTATGDAVLDATLGELSKPTPGTTTISAVSGGVSATPVDIIFSDPVVAQIPPPTDPVVVVRGSSGHPPIENTNPTVVTPPVSVLDTPENILAETVSIEIPIASPQIRKPVLYKKVAVKNDPVQEVPDQPVLLAASSEASFPIEKKTGIYAVIFAISLAVGWQIFIHHKNRIKS